MKILTNQEKLQILANHFNIYYDPKASETDIKKSIRKSFDSSLKSLQKITTHSKISLNVNSFINSIQNKKLLIYIIPFRNLGVIKFNKPFNLLKYKKTLNKHVEFDYILVSQNIFDHDHSEILAMLMLYSVILDYQKSHSLQPSYYTSKIYNSQFRKIVREYLENNDKKLTLQENLNLIAHRIEI